MRNSVVRTIAASLALMFAGSAVAQDAFPNLLGRWTGLSEVIIIGSSNHIPPESTAPELREVELEVVIDFQEGRRFSGTISSEFSTEALVGVISQTGRIYWVDEDGFNEASLLDKDTLEACYVHITEASTLAACEGSHASGRLRPATTTQALLTAKLLLSARCRRLLMAVCASWNSRR